MSLNPSSNNQIWLGNTVRERFFVSILLNIFRGGLSFLTVLMVARGLGPESYGNFIFLIGSFLAIQHLLEMGTSKAFFTFISKRSRGRNFIRIYLLWQLIQFSVPLLVIKTLLPDAWISSIWLGEDRALVLLSCAAVYLQQNAWHTVIQIGESTRLTAKVQVLWLYLSIVHCILVMVFWLWGFLSLTTLFSLIIIEYMAGLFIAEIVLSTRSLENIPIEFKAVFHEYAKFCAPLFIFSWAIFAKEFADRWFLQNFGGGIEQGFYGVAYQFALVCLLFTLSIEKIFLKEIAEAREKQDLERVRELYRKVTRFLFTIGGALSGFLIPWSREIIQVFLGASYMGGAGSLAVILLLPVYQSLALMTEVLYFTSQETKAYSIIGIIFIAIHVPVTYFVLAPGDAWLPGLEMGSLGMALKLVILMIISTNVMVWWISKNYGWEYDWSFQVIVLSFVLVLGWVCHEMVLGISSVLPMNIFVKFGLALMVYFSLVGLAIWKRPDLTGVTQEDIRDFIGQVILSFKVKA